MTNWYWYIKRLDYTVVKHTHYFLAKRDYVTFGFYAMANPSVCLSVCRLSSVTCVHCTVLRGLNFSGIFLHHIVAWPSGNSVLTHQKLRRLSTEITPNGGVKCKGWEKVAISDQYLVIVRKRLKIDRYMLRACDAFDQHWILFPSM